MAPSAAATLSSASQGICSVVREASGISERMHELVGTD